MKIAAIRDHLRQYLPSKSSLFTDDYSATITISNNVATINAPNFFMGINSHLKVGDNVLIRGVSLPNPITNIQTLGLNQYQITLQNFHDFSVPLKTTATISNAGSFNGDYDLIDVPDNFNIIIQADNGLSASFTGWIIQESVSYYNGLFPIASKSGNSSFTVTMPSTYNFTSSGIVCNFNSRIGAEIDFNIILDRFSDSNEQDWWAFVIGNEGQASKDKNVQYDGSYRHESGQSYYQEVSQPFDVFVVVNVSDEWSAIDIKDTCKNELLSALIGCLCGYVDESETAINNSTGITFISEGTGSYSEAYYIHAYRFDSTIAITDADIYKPDSVKIQSVDFQGTSYLTS